jgi:hypothetical protein
METKVQLNKVRLSDDSIRYFLKGTSIIVNSIRIILPNKNCFTARINNKEIFFGIQDCGSGWQEIVYPEWDEYDKYYYFDLKFYKDFKITSINLNINCHFDISKNVFIEYDSEYKKFDRITSESCPLSDFEAITEKVYHIMVYNGEIREDDPIDVDLKYVNDHEDFTIKRIKNDVYKLTLYDDSTIESLEWDTTSEEKDKGKIFVILSELPITNFPIQYKNKDFYRDRGENINNI